MYREAEQRNFKTSPAATMELKHLLSVPEKSAVLANKSNNLVYCTALFKR